MRSQALETSRNRLLVTGALLTLAFFVVAGRLVELTAFREPGETARVARAVDRPKERADVVDRNGILLATSLPTASLYANPRHVLDAEHTAAKLAAVLPDLSRESIAKKLASDGSFVWLHRNLTPEAQFRVNALGLPGLYFQKTERRVYPYGNLVSHVMGLTDIDGAGLSGLEKYFNDNLAGRASVLVVVSLPDFDPNHPSSAIGDAAFNRATKGVYEMGSTMKLFTAAMSLDAGTTDLERRYDATTPIKAGRFTIRDYHAKNRWLTVPEIMIHSSNIGAAKMALEVGTPTQRKYLADFGFLKPTPFGPPLTARV